MTRPPRMDAESVVERGAQILRALQRYQRGDGDHAALLAMLMRPEMLLRIAQCGSAIRSAFAWTVALVEAELPQSVRSRARGGR